MDKSELIKALSQNQKLSIKIASSIVNTILSTMTETLVNGDHIEIRNFGTFSVREYDSYIGSNPKTGKKLRVKPKKLPFFKVSEKLREAIDENRKK